jgi:hypothetical protein
MECNPHERYQKIQPTFKKHVGHMGKVERSGSAPSLALHLRSGD